MRSWGPDTGTSYSSAVSVEPGGWLFVSGHVALDPDGAVFMPDDMYAQTRFVLSSIESVLREAGGQLAHLVKLTVFVTDIGRYAEFARARSELLHPPYPASSAVEVSALIKPGLCVEINSVARIPESPGRHRREEG